MVSNSDSEKSTEKSGHNVRNGEYIIGKTIGKGTFSRVRICTNDNHSLKAMKIISKKSRNYLLNGVKHETAALLSLNHPNILPCTDILEDDKKVYIVTPFYEDGDLASLLYDRGSFSEQETKNLLAQLVDALTYAHSKGICHRDIKLENIFVKINNDGNIHCILGDWGLATSYSQKGLINESCGSIAYSSPEIITGSFYTGPEVDVWSLGVLLYALISGNLPFEYDIGLICTGLYEKLPYISSDLQDLLSRMLVVDRKKRITLNEIMSHNWIRSQFHRNKLC